MGGKNKGTTSYKLDYLFLRRLWKCCSIIFPGWLSTSSLLFILLLGLSITGQMFIYNTGLIPSRFYEVLLGRDEPGFESLLLMAFLLILGTALVNSLVKYVAKVLYVHWRGLLARYLHSGYFQNRVYYKLNVLQETLDNPDQRITQDVERFCDKFQSSVPVVIISPITIAYYTYQCYQSAGYLGPVIIYGYFVVGTIINKLIMTPIIGLVYKQEKLEGDFRFKHMQVRANAESIAFYKSDDLERRKTNSKLLNVAGNDKHRSLLQTQQRLVNFEFFLDFSVGCIQYLGAVLSYLIIAIALFGGMYDDLSPTALSGQISRNSFFAMYLIYRFTQLIDLSANVSDMAGYVHRIGQLIESFVTFEDSVLDEKKQQDLGVITVYVSGSYRVHQVLIVDHLSIYKVENVASHDHDTVFQLTGVTYGPPNSSDPLVKGLNLEIHLGTNILITGNTGSGKSSLLRVLCGIWNPISGEVRRFLPLSPSCIFFLPQKMFVTDGTLKQQVTYPLEDPVYQDYSETGLEERQRVLEILKTVGLTTLSERVGGIDQPVDSSWEDMLSPGEMQRLSFARLFFHRPQIALLDEATSALDAASETSLYSVCQQMGITVVSVGQRGSLKQFHDFNLRLDETKGWEFLKISKD